MDPGHSPKPSARTVAPRVREFGRAPRAALARPERPGIRSQPSSPGGRVDRVRRLRIIALVVTALAVLSLVACGDDDEPAASSAPAATTPAIPTPSEVFAEPVVRPWLHPGDVAEETRAARAVGLSPAAVAKLSDLSLPVPSQWSGQVQGTVYGRPFTLPLFVSLYPRQTAIEANPIRVYLGNRAETGLEEGGFLMASANEIRAPDGSPVTINYMDLDVRDGSVDGVLSNTGARLGAALNQFVATNVTALNAPPVYRPIAEALGPTEIFIFDAGHTRLSLRIDGDRLEGEVSGTGSSLTGIFPLPEVSFEARLSAQRTE